MPRIPVFPALWLIATIVALALHAETAAFVTATMMVERSIMYRISQ